MQHWRSFKNWTRFVARTVACKLKINSQLENWPDLWSRQRSNTRKIFQHPIFLPWQPCRENMCYHSKSYIIILFIFFVETLPAPVQLVLHIHLVPAGEKWNRDMWFVVLGNIATEANLVSSSMCLKAITSHSFLHMRPSYTVQQHGRVGQSQLFSQGLTHIPDKVTLRGLWSVPLCNVQEFCLTDMHTVHNCKNKKKGACERNKCTCNYKNGIC